MTKPIKKTDAELKRDVIRELTWDAHVNETQIGVEVAGGIVTLSGTTETYAERMAAQEAAHRVGGVLDVANDIQVKYTGMRTDSDIAKAVRNALEWDVFVPDERIRSTVASGVVTLEGDVDYLSQREDAVRVARGLAGVRNVIDRLQVKESASPLEVHRAIEEALERRAAREARDIKLEVQDGKVVLQGKVHSFAQRDLVVGAARGTRGVRSIEDRLEIWPQ